MLSRVAASTVSLAVLALVLVSCGDGQPAPASISTPTSAAASVSAAIVTPTPVSVAILPMASSQAPTSIPVTEPTPTLIPTSVPALAPTPAPTPTPELQYLAEEIPPCTPISGSPVDPCEPDVKIQTGVLGGVGSGGIFLYDQPQTVRAFLDGSSIGSVPHIVLRGTYIPDTARCTSGNPNRVPSYIEPGYHQHSILFQCFADVRVNGYILGDGPDRLTVQVSFLHYWNGYYAQDAANLGMTEQELIEQFLEIFVVILEEGYGRTGAGIYGREVVLFISPGHNHATEVWEVYRTWDVQRREDGTIIAVHPHRDSWRAARPDDYQTYRSSLEMGLPAFTQAVTAAHQARVTEYGGRIAPEDIQSRAEGVDLPMLVTDANQLRQFYADTGAYDHPDGPPAQPPPPCGLAVPDQANNPGLMRDCMALLAAKDSLRGAAALSWSTDIAITSWDGITSGGSPSRVTGLTLPSLNLSGSIPPELGELSGLNELFLHSNQLTGPIPPELGGLIGLQLLWLHDNQLTGAIPGQLGELSKLRQLSLYDNQLTGPIPTELGGLSELVLMFLHRNRLTDGIPIQLGELVKLRQLSLHTNQLTGPIPPEPGRLTRLEFLWLHKNLLTGKIPQELEELSNLQHLFLSSNQLTGCIPSGLRDIETNDLDDLGLAYCEGG